MSDVSDSAVVVRDSRDADMPAIARIYGHWVRHGLGTFEYEAPGNEEMIRRRSHLLEGKFPYLVAWDGSEVLGYAYAGPYRPRPGYRHSCEDSVYVAPEAAGRGIGRRLLSALVARCEAQNFRLMIAVIGDSGNMASIGLHVALGFARAGVLPSVGWKHGRWVDTVLMTRVLGEGNLSAPDA